MGPTRFLPAILLSAMAAFALGCGPAGAPPGASCSRPNQCASQLCLTRGDAGTCASRCVSSDDCTATGEVCGRFDFRGIDPDSGLYVGPLEDVVHVCRPRLNAHCSASSPCTQPGATCVGDPGVCTTTCAVDGDCASRLCLPGGSAACGLPGTCAPACDSALECPRGWYCNPVATDATGHGRCETMDLPMGDAACGDAAR